MIRSVFTQLLFVALLAASVHAADAERTVAKATTALHEIMAVPLKGIPESLLADAEAVAIFPSVVKVGFVAGVERGHGVVTIRDDNHNWGAPRFVTVTGGSVGWQIGASATDLVLVFKTRKSVENLLNGKFKIGADIAAAAGPVGRRAEAATDGQLQAEIYSYSRSRGLFAGASVDGAVIQLDSDAEFGYYRMGPDGRVAVPESGSKLVSLVAAYSKDSGNLELKPAESVPLVEDPMEKLRKQVVNSSDQLGRLVDDSWKRFLALPADIYVEAGQPSKPALDAAVARYELVARDPKYAALAKRAEFQAARLALEQYVGALQDQGGVISLPAPPR
jgi:lipid-binding SYLF domain-containing protein